MNMFNKLRQFSDMGLLILRIGIAAIFMVHGTAKFSMWSVEPGPQLPAGMVYLMRFLSIAEPLTAAALLIGYLTPFACIVQGLVMMGAIATKINAFHLGFMEQKSTGWELDFLILCAVLNLLFTGPGKISLDSKFFKPKAAPETL